MFVFNDLADSLRRTHVKVEFEDKDGTKPKLVEQRVAALDPGDSYGVGVNYTGRQACSNVKSCKVVDLFKKGESTPSSLLTWEEKKFE
jgi:hypothetical protein